MYCSNCGSKLEEGTIFCPECGQKVEEMDETRESIQENEAGQQENSNWNQMPNADIPQQKPKGHGGRVIAVFFSIVVLIVAVVFAVVLYPIIKDKNKTEKVTSNKTMVSEESEESEETEDKTEEADIVATGGESCSLEGNVKTDAGGNKLLTWDEDMSISGLDENGEQVLAKEVTNVYINDIGLEIGVLDTVPSNKSVVVSGQIYFIGDAIYMKANEITGSDGSIIENNKNRNSEVKQSTISYDYIISYSSNVLLSESDIAGLSLQEINYAKNEIYARHGRLFDSPELQSHFNSKSWYYGTVEPSDFSNVVLSDVEKKNSEYLSAVEFGINPNGYQLDAN